MPTVCFCESISKEAGWDRIFIPLDPTRTWDASVRTPAAAMPLECVVVEKLRHVEGKAFWEVKSKELETIGG